MSNSTYTRLGHPRSRNEATLYRRNGVRVTTLWLVVGAQTYAVRELRSLRTAQGDRRRTIGIRTVIAAGSLLVVIIGATQNLSIPIWVAAAAGLVIPAAAVLIAMANAPRACELWADYRGMTVRLLWMDDREQYNQICRALTRAKEKTG